MLEYQGIDQDAYISKGHKFINEYVEGTRYNTNFALTKLFSGKGCFEESKVPEKSAFDDGALLLLMKLNTLVDVTQ
ncbi:unnamed protein product [Angiostrongylus costaricensis]|uniref:Peptidase_M13 domain-containing protein n=1 Tax=Angiostrongylus costaricensis TaxID=334426 RepID=A0A0R3PEE6_ANGCS|nr:unnamed protein product [Angiostrongylus costaricensis]